MSKVTNIETTINMLTKERMLPSILFHETSSLGKRWKIPVGLFIEGPRSASLAVCDQIGILPPLHDSTTAARMEPDVLQDSFGVGPYRRRGCHAKCEPIQGKCFPICLPQVDRILIS